jgi:hydroxymethylpyrimidine kinase/phosphomethylpyrimidine kinase
LGAKNVLIKGGHLKSKKMIDILINKKSTKEFESKKHNSKNTHGTGCTLSSAIATYLSCGKDLIKSCELGIKYVNEAIKTNSNLGKGNGPINHLNSINLNKRFR